MINQAGSCDYCDAHVTAGEFDWVLSRIEQDEVVDHSVVAGCRHRDTSLLEPASIGFTFVAKRVVLRGDDQRRIDS